MWGYNTTYIPFSYDLSCAIAKTLIASILFERACNLSYSSKNKR